MTANDDFLKDPPFALTDIDRKVLATRDEDFERYDWPRLQSIVARHALAELKRLPSDLKRYLQWSYETKLAYGNITNFVVQERLHWTPKHAVTAQQSVTADSFTHYSAVPFQDARDFTILKNDWPYGFEDAVTHIVVWSRTPIAVDTGLGDMTSESKKVTEAFVQHTFVQGLADFEHIPLDAAAARVLWFKNWVGLQSVRGVDHIHVLLKDADASWIASLTSTPEKST